GGICLSMYGCLGRVRRYRYAILDAREIGGAVAGDDAVIDHLEVRRRHSDRDLLDRAWRDAARDDVFERLRRRHGLPRRAPRLEGHLCQIEAFAERLGEGRDVGRNAEDTREQWTLDQFVI